VSEGESKKKKGSVMGEGTKYTQNHKYS